jgi:phage tail sheath gpL-like
MIRFERGPVRVGRATAIALLAVVAGALLTAVPASASAGHFTLSISPTSQTVAVDGTATYTVTSHLVQCCVTTAHLSVTGAPAGSAVTLTPSGISTNGGHATVQINTSSSTPPGTYVFTVTGEGFGRSDSVNGTIVVT